MERANNHCIWYRASVYITHELHYQERKEGLVLRLAINYAQRTIQILLKLPRELVEPTRNLFHWHLPLKKHFILKNEACQLNFKLGGGGSYEQVLYSLAQS